MRCVAEPHEGVQYEHVHGTVGSFTEGHLSALERAEREQLHRVNSDLCTVYSLRKEN